MSKKRGRRKETPMDLRMREGDPYRFYCPICLGYPCDPSCRLGLTAKEVADLAAMFKGKEDGSGTKGVG